MPQGSLAAGEGPLHHLTAKEEPAARSDGGRWRHRPSPAGRVGLGEWRAYAGRLVQIREHVLRERAPPPSSRQRPSPKSSTRAFAAGSLVQIREHVLSSTFSTRRCPAPLAQRESHALRHTHVIHSLGGGMPRTRPASPGTPSHQHPMLQRTSHKACPPRSSRPRHTRRTPSRGRPRRGRRHAPRRRACSPRAASLEVLELDIHPQHRDFDSSRSGLSDSASNSSSASHSPPSFFSCATAARVALRGLGLLVVVVVVRRLAEEAFFIAAAARSCSAVLWLHAAQCCSADAVVASASVSTCLRDCMIDADAVVISALS